MRSSRWLSAEPLCALALTLSAAGLLLAQGTPPQTQKKARTGKQVATLQTSKGTITFELLPDLAPEHVRNFVELAKSGFYDGTKFHRVIPGFMIQGGDPNSKSDNVNAWGSGNGPRTLKAEFSPKSKASHVRGMVSMARRGDSVDSASCQFFIVHKDSPFLDEQYSIFGRVLSGLQVVDDIANTPVVNKDTNRPVVPIVIQKVTIEER